MDVFLVPVGSEVYELYFESAATEPDVDEAQRARGLVKRAIEYFRVMLARVEREHYHAATDPAASRPGMMERARKAMMRRLAESVAEQRLLWRLRTHSHARLCFPSDMPAARAQSVMRDALRRDARRRLFWFAVDGLIFLASGIVAIVPGPNLIAYYLAFRSVGHYLSWRGAVQGLTHVEWEMRPCEPLTELRAALALAPPLRDPRIRAIGEALNLARLGRFIERTAVPAA